MRLQNVAEKIPEVVKEDLPEGAVIEEISQGLKVWSNPVNKFKVIRLHYLADPRKRTPEWKENARAGLSWAEWMREYEIVFSSFDGIPVYADHYSRKFHVSDEPLTWADDYPVVRGWDFGVGGMACVWAQLLSSFRLFVYRELCAVGVAIDKFAEEVKARSLEWFPGCRRYFDVCDPSGFNRSGTAKDTASYVDTIRKELHTKPTPGVKGINDRLKSVRDFLKENVKGAPKFLVDGSGCPTIVDGFDGGYHYAYHKAGGQLKDDPEKNEYSHPHDALQYLCSKIMHLDLNALGSPMVGSTGKYGFGK